MLEFTLKIDAFSPETLPMARLAEYMAALADLIGFKDSTHFIKLERGSARLVHAVETHDAPKVELRLHAAASNDNSDVKKAMATLDDLLAADNATGELLNESGKLIIPFAGRNRPKPLIFPSFRQDGTIDGQIVNIGGRDATAHIILQDGQVTYSNINIDRDMAKELAPHLYGAKIRLIGSGRWERLVGGVWRLTAFTVDRYAILDDAPLSDVLSDIRSLAGDKLSNDKDIYSELNNLRISESDIH